MRTALCNMVFMIVPHEVIAIDEGELLCIHPDGSIDRDAFRPMMYASHYKWTMRSICGWDDIADSPDDEDNISQLLDICGYFGVTEDEVRYLRELGYSCDEIEEFLFDPLAFHEAMMCEEI